MTNKSKLKHADWMKVFFDCLAPKIVSRLEARRYDSVFIDEVVSDVSITLWEKMRAGQISFESVQDLTKWVSSCARIIEKKNWIKHLEHFFNERHTLVDLPEDIDEDAVWKEICSLCDPETAVIAAEEIRALRAAYKALPCLWRIFLEKKTPSKTRKRKKGHSKKGGAKNTRFSRAFHKAKAWYVEREVTSMNEAILLGKRILRGHPVDLSPRSKKKR